MNHQSAHHAAAEHRIEGIIRDMARREACQVVVRIMLRLRPDQAGEALYINVETGKAGQIANYAGNP
ncbi:Uncharacterised protein [Shigella sonnei]|nr:Uncharacterised protein [Shigella sonnei]